MSGHRLGTAALMIGLAVGCSRTAVPVHVEADSAPVEAPPPPRELPDSEYPIAMQGYCPVTLAVAKKFEKGDPRFGVVHRRRTFLFVTAQQQASFLEEPDQYTPALTGYDPMRFLQSGEMVDGSPEHSLSYRGQTYLFINEDSLRAFEENPGQTVKSIQETFAQREM